MSSELMVITLIISDLLLINGYLNNSFLEDWLRGILLIIILVISILIAIHNLKLKKKKEFHKEKANRMYQKSICDGMTGVYNHAYIVNRLKDINQKYTLMMLDIDDFKEINDNYGHQVGDEVIKYVAKQIKENVRKTDLVGRYGGDEFLIVFIGCDKLDEINLVVNKIKQKIEMANKKFGKLNFDITVSAGIESVTDSSFDKALNKVDNALYQAKENGKSKIVINL